MTLRLIVGAVVALLPACAPAQAMSCAAYLQADERMQAQMKGAASTRDPSVDRQTAAFDKKLKAYCLKHPRVGVDKAMEIAAD